MKFVRALGLFLAVFATAMLGFLIWLHCWVLNMEQSLRSMNKFTQPLSRPGPVIYVVWSLVLLLSIGMFRWAGKKRDGDKMG